MEILIIFGLTAICSLFAQKEIRMLREYLWPASKEVEKTLSAKPGAMSALSTNLPYCCDVKFRSAGTHAGNSTVKK
jgi:hypothetical protein